MVSPEIGKLREIATGIRHEEGSDQSAGVAEKNIFFMSGGIPMC